MLGWKGNFFPKEKQRHLYLVLDEWSRGYSICKIDLSVGDGDGDGDGVYSMPPAMFMLEAPHAGPKYFAGAFGSKILAMQPMDPQLSFNPMAGVPIYDVCMRTLMIGPRQRPDPVDPIYIPVGGRLFALAAGSFQLLYPPPDDDESDEEEEDFVWRWHTLPDPPFQHEHVTSYAVHRDGRTIFVSIGDQSSPATFIFDTAESARDGCMWKQHGQWQLPFSGRAYFVSELDAWVGLSKKPGTSSWRICSMDVISDQWDNGQAVKYAKEELESGSEIIMGITLVSMGGGSKFCVLLCCLEGLSTVLRLVTFSLMYDKNGELTTGNSWQLRKYTNFTRGVDISREMLYNPVAFWM